MKYQAPEIEWKTEQETEADGFCSYEANTATHKYRIYYSDVMKSWMCTYYRFSKPETKHKYLPTAQELKEWVETTHYPSALRKAGFKPVSQEAVDAWLEKHPLNDFNGSDSINDLLEIDDYEPLSAYLSINSFEVSGVSK